MKRHNVFAKKINKMALSSDDDKIMQSIYFIETYAYGTGKGLVSEKEEIKCKKLIKQHEKWLTLMMLRKNTRK